MGGSKKISGFVSILLVLAYLCVATDADSSKQNVATSSGEEPDRESFGSYIISLKHDLVGGLGDMLSVEERILAQYSLDIEREICFGELRLLVVRSYVLPRELLTWPEVEYVEPNLVVHLAETFCQRQKTGLTYWGLSRISQRERLPTAEEIEDESKQLPVYSFSSEALGSGVDVYVVDSGIYTEHPQFGSRARSGFVASGLGESMGDNYGHGTLVAGIIGAMTYGVAKDVNLVSVKVAESQFTVDYLLEGLEWILQQNATNDTETATGSVINLSLVINEISELVESKIRSIVSRGHVVVVAAGNQNGNACDNTPSRMPEVITVGATGIRDHMSNLSNWGSCVDIFAPGEGIMSTFIPPLDTAEASGTSMAAPHVVGVIARHLSLSDVRLTPEEVKAWLLREATVGAIQFPPEIEETGNRLVYMECDEDDPADNGSSGMAMDTLCLFSMSCFYVLFSFAMIK